MVTRGEMVKQFRLHTVFGQIRPGRIDGLIGLLVSSWALAGTWGISLFVNERTLYTLPLGVVFAIAVGSTFGLLATANLWLLFGSATLTRRCTGTLLIGCIPCCGWALGYAYGFGGPSNHLHRFPWGIEAILALVLFRIASTCVCAFLSMGLRLATPWRIVNGDSEPTQRSMFQTSIGEVMLLTALVAAAVGSLRIIWTIDSPRGSLVLGWMMVALGVEMVSLLLFVLLPLAVDRRGKGRRRVPTLLPVWTAVLGAFSAIVYFFLRSQGRNAEAISMLIFWASFGFGAYTLLCWRTAELVGLRWTRAAADDGQSVARLVRPTWNPLFAGVVAVAMIGSIRFIYCHNFIALIHGERLAVARQVATVSRLLGCRPQRTDEYSVTYSWKTRGMSISARPSARRVIVRAKEELPAELVAAAVPTHESSVKVSIATPHIDDGILGVLANRSLEMIEFRCEQLDPMAFDHFCRSTNSQTVSLRGDALSPDHVRSLHQMKALRKVHFPIPKADSWYTRRGVHPIVLSDEMDDALRGLPIPERSEMAVQIPSGGGSLSSLSGLSRLLLVRTELTTDVCDALAREGLFCANTPVRHAHDRPNLDLIDCPVDGSAAVKLREIRAPWITWTLSGKESNTRKADLLALASIPNLIGLDVADVEPAAIFSRHFRIRRGNGLPRCLLSAGRSGLGADYPDHDSDDDHLADALSRHSDDLELALAELANAIGRNDAGEIEALDLQWIPIAASGVSKLRRISSLRRLRIGHRYLQTSSLFESIAALHHLRVLEIPTPWVTDADLEQIGKLANLKRLQLPLHYEDPVLPHPEGIPFPNINQSSALEAPEASLDYGGAYGSFAGSSMDLPDLKRLLAHHGIPIGETDGGGRHEQWRHEQYWYSVSSNVTSLSSLAADQRLTDDGIVHLSSLQQMEYLFMPGFLLSPKSLSAIESLPKLRQLHALFSLVSPALLKRIAALDLEALSIGVADVDALTANTLRKMRLKTLQLFVFNSAYATSPQEQERVSKLLRIAMPNCDVHLQFLQSVR